jgi:hypothetical protein
MRFCMVMGPIVFRAALDDRRLLVEVIDQGSGFERTVLDGVEGFGMGRA